METEFPWSENDKQEKPREGEGLELGSREEGERGCIVGDEWIDSNRLGLSTSIIHSIELRSIV